ncbi:MAG: flavodoxin family protein [Candidatus Omnitrophica bacterium]|nr:flavodoxin family protein [Candidatus Omnitrophota bacterium]MDD5488565.1 flavodoxin family protein [Candidatus Omnitrophota bacterium]
MRILAINGSPRHGGNTETLMDSAIEGAVSLGADVEKITLEGLSIHPCSQAEYDKVSESGLSIVDDDMNRVFERYFASDAVLVGSPVFFGSISGQLKVMVDRFQCVWLSRNRKRKNFARGPRKGVFICVGAQDRTDHYDNASSIVRNLFAATSVTYAGGAFFPGLENSGDALGNKAYLEKAFELGRSLVEVP